MKSHAATELILIRHAPALTGGRLCGRTDVGADCSDTARIAAVRDAVGPAPRILRSPARRCGETAGALWPSAAIDTDAALWEQDFGAWEGLAYADLRDLGALDRRALAAHRPPGGESFADMAARVGPALERAATGGPVVIVAHAGVIRAALGLALGAPEAGLAFEIAPLSVTRILASPSGQSIRAVNWAPA